MKNITLVQGKAQVNGLGRDSGYHHWAHTPWPESALTPGFSVRKTTKNGKVSAGVLINTSSISQDGLSCEETFSKTL